MIFTDMDGVVAVYDRKGFILREDGSMPFMDEGIHYFSKCEPDYRMIDACDLISADHDFAVMSNIMDDKRTEKEHTEDKTMWSKKKMPFLDVNKQLYIIKEPKYKMAERLLNRPLEKTDVLISDYKNDLYPWIEAGGTAIKYLNGLNDPNSYPGPKITPEMEPEEIKRYVEFFIA